MKTQYLRVGSAIAAASALLALAACSASPSSDGASVEGVWGAPDTRGEPSLEFTPTDAAGDDTGDATGNATPRHRGRTGRRLRRQRRLQHHRRQLHGH